MSIEKRLFKSIDENVIPYEAHLTVLENREQCTREKRTVDRQLKLFYPELKRVFSEREILILRNKLYQKADLRCAFREMQGHLPPSKLQRLGELEQQTSSDRGQKFKQSCYERGILRERVPLKARENKIQKEKRVNKNNQPHSSSLGDALGERF